MRAGPVIRSTNILRLASYRSGLRLSTGLKTAAAETTKLHQTMTSNILLDMRGRNEKLRLIGEGMPALLH